MTTETYRVTFRRDMERAIRPKSAQNNITALLASITTPTRTNRGWSFDAGEYVEIQTDEVERRYEITWTIGFNHPTNKPQTNELDSILFKLYTKAQTPAYGLWTLRTVDGKPYIPPSERDQNVLADVAESIDYADIEMPSDEEWDAAFSHIYGLDAQIGRVKSALRIAISSNFTKRFNVVLIGPPGCGKSEIAKSLIRLLGTDATMELDATATTQAGIQKEFKELQLLPRVVAFEELEKAPESSMQPLLSMLDQRGEIRKVTARENVQRDTKILGIATVNNRKLFDGLQAGALSSRFSNPVFFGRPSRDILAKVLVREIETVNGNTDWVIPALDYCESRGIDDPRQVISICLCGGDDLLDGSFQKMMDATSQPIE